MARAVASIPGRLPDAGLAWDPTAVNAIWRGSSLKARR